MGLKNYFSGIYRAIKAIPFPADGGTGSFLNNLPWGNSWIQYPNTAINYANEVGPLTGSSLVMAAVNWVGTNLPEAPVQVLRQKSDGTEDAVKNHPLVKLLNRPNQYYSGQLLWRGFALSWIIDGNAYFIKIRNSFKQVIELWYEPHFSIRPRWPDNGSEFIEYYELYRNGRWYRVDKEDVVHFRYGFDPYNTRLGLSPLASAYREIFTDNERARYSALILRNGGVISFLITPKEAGKQINVKEFKAEWEYRTSGDNIGKPMVVNAPIEMNEMGSTPDKLLVDKASKIPEERVAALIGIPAAVLGFGVGLEQTKIGATMRELREQSYESFVIPTLRQIDPELTAQLLIPDFPGSENMIVGHDLAKVRVLQDDQNALATRQALLYEKGIIKRSEARSAVGMQVEQEDDVYFVEPSPPVDPNNPFPNAIPMPAGDVPKETPDAKK